MHPSIGSAILFRRMGGGYGRGKVVQWLPLDSVCPCHPKGCYCLFSPQRSAMLGKVSRQTPYDKVKTNRNKQGQQNQWFAANLNACKPQPWYSLPVPSCSSTITHSGMLNKVLIEEVRRERRSFPVQATRQHGRASLGGHVPFSALPFRAEQRNDTNRQFTVGTAEIILQTPANVASAERSSGGTPPAVGEQETLRWGKRKSQVEQRRNDCVRQGYHTEPLLLKGPLPPAGFRATLSRRLRGPGVKKTSLNSRRKDLGKGASDETEYTDNGTVDDGCRTNSQAKSAHEEENGRHYSRTQSCDPSHVAATKPTDTTTSTFNPVQTALVNRAKGDDATVPAASRILRQTSDVVAGSGTAGRDTDTPKQSDASTSPQPCRPVTAPSPDRREGAVRGSSAVLSLNQMQCMAGGGLSANSLHEQDRQERARVVERGASGVQGAIVRGDQGSGGVGVWKTMPFADRSAADNIVSPRGGEGGRLGGWWPFNCNSKIWGGVGTIRYPTEYYIQCTFLPTLSKTPR